MIIIYLIAVKRFIHASKKINMRLVGIICFRVQATRVGNTSVFSYGKYM